MIVAARSPNFIPLQQVGSVKILAVAGPERTVLAPLVPTAAEAGFPELTFDSPLGLYGARGIDPALIERISADVRSITREPTFRQKLIESGVAPRDGTPTEFAASILAQREKIAAIHHSMDKE